MPGLYFGSVKLASAEDVQDGDMDITGIYSGGTQIFPDDDGPYTLRGDINDNVVGGTPSPESYNIQGEKGDTGTFIVTVSPNTNYTIAPSDITGVSGVGNDITEPSSWTQSGVNVVGTFSYEFPESGYGLNRTRTDNFTINGNATFVPSTYTYTINFVDNTGDNMSFSTTAITITGVEGVSLNGMRNVVVDNGFTTKTLTAFDNTTVLSTTDNNDLTVSWTGSMPNGGGSATITVGGTTEETAKTISGSISEFIIGASVTPSTYEFKGNPGTSHSIDIVVDADTGKQLLSDVRLSGISQGNSSFLSASVAVATDTVLNDTSIVQYTITLTGVIQSSNRFDSVSILGNTADLISVAWASGTETVATAGGTFNLTFYSTDEEPPTVTKTESASYITVGAVTYSNGVGTVSIIVDENAGGIRSATLTVTSSLTDDADGLILTQTAAADPDTATTGYFNGFQGDDKPTDDIQLSPMVTTHDYTVTTNGSWKVTIFAATPDLEVPGITVDGYGKGTANGTVRLRRASNAPSTGTVNVRLSPDNDSSVILQQLAVTFTPEN